jgi:esterase
MKILRINDHDMPYLEIGQGSPVVCVHGSLSDFRAWNPVLKPLSIAHRVIVPSLRHFFPENWDGTGGRFTINQHVEDLIAFIETLALGPVHLIGHSRGGHIGFRLASRRPDLLRNLVLAEPGGTLEDALLPADAKPIGPAAGSREHVELASTKIAAGDLEGGLQVFTDAINKPGSWDALSLADRQMRIDNAYTLIAQVNEGREPFTRAQAEALRVPTLFVGGADTGRMLAVIMRVLPDLVPGAQRVLIPQAGHSMMRQQPGRFCEAVLPFLT